jgi:glutamine synthetase
MCCPALNGFDASGWHLHQSLFHTDSGINAFIADSEALSELARHYVAGLLEHAGAASVFSTPTVNGYKRLTERFSLSPDRAVWSMDNRGTYVRVLAEPNAPSSHIENRVGEPAANPYLYIAPRSFAGLDGIDRKLEPGPLTDDPHSHDAAPLPTSLREAVEALKADVAFRDRMGHEIVDFLVRIKEHELGRYEAAVSHLPPEAHVEAVTDWEQREYFRVF